MGQMLGLSDKQIYCFMDYETTGVETTKNTWVVPIQIGCVFADRDMDCLLEYQNLIKWDLLMQQTNGWTQKQQGAYDVHHIELKDVQEKGLWPYEVKRDLNEIIAELQAGIGTKKRPVIISDAPNFEMFFTEMIYTIRGLDFPFYYNAWSVYPLFQVFGVKALYGRKPHDALDDARLLLEGMQEVWAKAKRLKML